jgi:ankyrin repeat protein
MRTWLKRISVGTAASMVALSMITGTWYALLPTPKSDPLVDKQGVALDAETERKLVEVVFEAARQNDERTIDEYLKEGFSPNVRNDRGDTLLTVAAYRGSDRVVTRLLYEESLELEARNRMGLTAVAAASFQGHDAILEELLRCGADPNAGNGLGQTAVMFAALAGRTSAIRILSEAGADLDARDASGNTPDSLARGQGGEAVAAFVLEQRTKTEGGR